MPKGTHALPSLLWHEGYGGWLVTVFFLGWPPALLGFQAQGCGRSQYHREVGRADYSDHSNWQLHPYRSGPRPGGHPCLSPTPKTQSIGNSFWLSLQNTPRIQRFPHLHCSHPSPSQHATHLNYVSDILSGSMISPFYSSVHTGAVVTVQNSILM